MSRIAVDIVLLPDPSTTRWALEINQGLVKNHASEIVLHAEHCLPHISLAMGCIDSRDIDDITLVLKALAKVPSMCEAQAAGLAMTFTASGRTVSALAIAKTRDLQELHEAVMQALHPFFRFDVTPDMLYGEKPISESTLAWIRHYAQQSSFSRFLPHITLGYGILAECSYPHIIRIAKLALCHLGNHCTCRRILALMNVD